MWIFININWNNGSPSHCTLNFNIIFVVLLIQHFVQVIINSISLVQVIAVLTVIILLAISNCLNLVNSD